jgi:hypothetical protein
VTLPVLILMLPWFAATQSQPAMGECSQGGPRKDESAWSATVVSNQPRVYFLKSRAEDADCPTEAEKCRRKSYLVPGDSVLAWSRSGDTFCAMYASPRGKVSVGRLWASSTDFHGTGKAPTAEDWAGEWKNDGPEANLSITRLDPGNVEIEGFATWGQDDPERVANGGVHVGEIGPVRLRLTGHALHFVGSSGDSIGNAPPAAASSYDCIVDIQWKEHSLLVSDNYECGGMNVTFSGTYHRTRP